MLRLKGSCTATLLYALGFAVVSVFVVTTLLQRSCGLGTYLYTADRITFSKNNRVPLIFIGGVPRSGTTLMRVLLDAHSEVRCGEETRVIPRILGMRKKWEKNKFETKRLQEAGLTYPILDAAIASFILEIIVKHGYAAPRLCNKDPLALKYTLYLSRLFPQSKFILMIRDGRAVVNSMAVRNVTISGFNISDFRDTMGKWNTFMEGMYDQCIRIGPARCMPVYYEQLVLHPEVWLKRILSFLDLPWDDKVLHHEDFVGKPGGVSLSKTEVATDQVIKPINLEALTKWAKEIPEDVKNGMAKLAPMLSRLGYDPDAYPPNYGEPDKIVLENIKDIQQNYDQWRQRQLEIVLERRRIGNHS